MSTSPGTALVGTVLGGSYKVTRLIGQGGMGAVYEGVQLRLERRVAVKLMARELSANAEAIARFRREAEVTSQLGHPHIVQVFDFGQAPTGEPYLVMEYLEGEDLEKRLGRVGKMSAPAASHIIRQVASALSATHAKGIVHRDLKPANVFLLSVEGETDFVKVVDFGISKVRAAGTKLTAALAVMGTPNYMAPEQAAGRVDEIDHRTDQWALACIAYELLAGRPPFIGEDVASLLYQVIHQAPSPLASMNPGLPQALEGVLQRALSKTQGARFQTMTEFSRAFEGAATGKAAPVTAPSVAVQPTVTASAGVPPVAATGGVPPITTFSHAAGEAIPAGTTMQVRPVRRWLLAGLGIAVAAAAGAGGFAFISRRSAAPMPATTSAATAPLGAANAAVVRQPPAPAPAVGAVDAGAAQVAAAQPAPPASGPDTKKSRRPRPAWPPPPRGHATAAPTPAPEPAPVVAAPPPPPAEPPPPPPAAAPPPAWPPPAGAPPPAWPPPNGPSQPQQKRPNIFKRIFR